MLLPLSADDCNWLNIQKWVNVLGCSAKSSMSTLSCTYNTIVNFLLLFFSEYLISYADDGSSTAKTCLLLKRCVVIFIKFFADLLLFRLLLYVRPLNCISLLYWCVLNNFAIHIVCTITITMLTSISDLRNGQLSLQYPGPCSRPSDGL